MDSRNEQSPTCGVVHEANKAHLRRLESFGTKSLDVRNTFFRHCLVNT